MSNKIVEHNPGLAYITFKDEVMAAVTVGDSSGLFAVSDADPLRIKGKSADSKEEERYIVPWGEDNKLPLTINTKVDKLPDMSSNMYFNIHVAYGQGIVPVYIKRDFDGNILKEEIRIADDKKVLEFFENNDMQLYLLEQLTDLNYFWNTFPEIILNENKEVVEIRSKEAMFSRWCVDKDTGRITDHAYCAKWGVEEEPTKPEQVAFTPVLDEKNSIIDLKRRIGLAPALGKTTATDSKQRRFVIPINMPSPGRTYYQKPPWYSLIESGWYDFACSIPEFKKAILSNQMTIKYQILIHKKYWEEMFASEGITGLEEQKARRKKEYENMRDFLSGAKNSGKAVIHSFTYSQSDGKEQPLVKFVSLENHFKGGEYIEDSEEVSNIIAYGMNVHSSLIGSHGKGGTINGTEARELFIIKQAMMKPFRDRILKPLYLIKAINNWPKDLHFVIPNLELTTLDKNTGAQKNIGNGTV